MTHGLYKWTLLGGEVVRLLKTRVASRNHRLHTSVVNKKSLSGYDDKRFILSDQVPTLPYGHSAKREDMLFRAIVNEPDWGPDDFSESEQKSGEQAQDSSRQAQDSSQQAQDSSQLVKNKNQQKNAIEDSDSSLQPPITIDEQPPVNLPITIELQNLQDQPPTKKRRRARIIESNSEEDWRTKTKLKSPISSCNCTYIV